MQSLENRFPARWSIAKAQLKVETFSSLIWSVVLESGERAVVKELKPFDDMADELRGAHYLSWRGGTGAVRLMDVDGSRMLLENGGERLLSKELATSGDVHATDIICEVLARILSPSPVQPPVTLQPLKERFSSLFRKVHDESSQPVDRLYVEAANIADQLLADARDQRPLHADIHHDNIIHGPRGWLAIDPKGVYGDPAFEAANVFYNPLDDDDLCGDATRIARLAEAFSRVTKQSPTRLLNYALAYGCLSAAWHAEDCNRKEEQRELAIAAAIRGVRDHM